MTCGWVEGTNLTPVLLAELYQQMGDRQIAAMYGVTKPSVRALRMQWGLAPLGKTDRAKLKKEPLLDRQEEICSINVPTVLHSVSYCKTCGKPTPLADLESGSCTKCITVRRRACEGCGVLFTPTRSDNRFHDEACYARYKRAKQREAVPAKTSRTFTCKDCGKQWETGLGGRYSICPACVEAKLEARRTKTCAYRLCGVTFKDTSSQNSMQYCCSEHSRREKMFRLGLAKDESYFRKK